MLFCRTVFHVSLHGSWPDTGLMLFSQKQKLRKDTAALPCGPASPLPHSKTTCCSKFTVSTSHWRRQCAHMEDLIQRKTKEMKNDSAICRDHEGKQRYWLSRLPLSEDRLDVSSQSKWTSSSKTRSRRCRYLSNSRSFASYVRHIRRMHRMSLMRLMWHMMAPWCGYLLETWSDGICHRHMNRLE